MSGFKRPERPALKARPKDTTEAQIEALDAVSAEQGFTVRAEPAKRGRPSKGRSASDPRPSFALDPETHAAFKIWLLRKGVSMQDYLEAHIKALVHASE